MLLRLATQAQQTQQVVEELARELLARCDMQRTATELSLLVAPLSQESNLIVCETLRLAWREAQVWPSKP